MDKMIAFTAGRTDAPDRTTPHGFGVMDECSSGLGLHTGIGADHPCRFISATHGDSVLIHALIAGAVCDAMANGNKLQIPPAL